MANYYKLDTNGYPQTYQGKAPLDDSWKEFEVATDEVTGISLYHPEELNDAIVALQAKEDKAKQIAEATKYLSDTDWVIVKITEMQLEGVDTTSLMEKYKEELINRTHYRNLINSLEE